MKKIKMFSSGLLFASTMIFLSSCATLLSGTKDRIVIDYGLGYDMGDYSFGKGDGKELRNKIVESIKFMKIQFDRVFNEDGNTLCE